MIDTIRLQVFVATSESNNYTEAAKLVNLSQPTVSYHIKQLELDLGVDLFDRTDSHQLRLTEAGRLLLPRARKLLHDINSIHQLVSSMSEATSGDIRIACSATTARYILPLFAARFRQQHPDSSISIMACTPEQVIPRLLCSEANLGIVSYEGCNEDFECQIFFTDYIIFIVPENHAWASRRCIEPAELIDVPFIMREQGSGTRRALLTELGKHDIALTDLNILLEIGNTEAVIKAVEGGFGVSFISHLAASWALKLGTIVEVPVTGFELHRKIYMMRHNLQAGNRATDVFWDFIHTPSNADLMRQAEQ